MLERGDERQPDALARHGDLRRVALGDEQAVRSRLDPGRLGQDVQVGGIGLDRGAEIHRPRASLPAAQHVETDVRCDAIEPRAKRRPALESIVRAPRADERLLDGILRLERRRQHPIAVAGELGSALLQPPFDLCRVRPVGDRRVLHGVIVGGRCDARRSRTVKVRALPADSEGMGGHRYESVALALAASDAYENADENLEVIDAAIGDMRSQVALDEEAFAELVARFRLVLDTNRTAPAVMRIMVSAEAARTAADEARDPGHGWLSRRHWHREAERTSRELVSHVATTLDALISEAY